MHCALAALGLAVVAVAQPGFHGFDCDVWPGEGVPRFASRGLTLVLQQDPDAASPVAHRLRLAPGVELTYDQTRYRTVTAGRLTALEASRVSGRSFGADSHVTRASYYSPRPTTSLNIARGTTIELLQYRAEGSCFLRVAEQIFEADECPSPGPLFEQSREPAVQHWLHLVRSGKPVGWLLIDDKMVRRLARAY
jgi:hypothetical protein